MQPQQIIELHANVLGLCAYVSAFPYDVPDMLPQVLVTLSDHLNDPHPIPVSAIYFVCRSIYKLCTIGMNGKQL